ncbi:dna polymerase alpha [Cystoisospora suis]|uniref:DNA polymerase alpha subunit B n=1 Tax=Cystoisospora suis TaxID=483139 RepID=A0A2C6L1M5_9APIC|nr:dna polymerase alpha [Cystoisospora suis]
MEVQRRDGIDARMLPALLHSLLTESDRSSALGLCPATATWTKLRLACEGADVHRDKSNISPGFVQHVEDALKASPEGVGTRTAAALDNADVNSLSRTIEPWQRSRAEFKEEETILFNPELGKIEGYRCDNKTALQLSCTFDFNNGSLATDPFQVSRPEWMDAVAYDHGSWRRNRLQLLRSRMHIGWSRNHVTEGPEASAGPRGEQVRTGILAAVDGRPFSFVSMVLDEMTARREPVQLLHPEEALARQYRQRTRDMAQEDGASQLHGATAPLASKPVTTGRAAESEVCAYPGMLVTVRGFLDKSDCGTRFAVASIQGGCPLPPPRCRRVVSLPPHSPTTASCFKQKLDTRSVESCYRGHPVHIMVASAQFLSSCGEEVESRNLEMDILLNRVREEAPHILILFGPIVPSSLVSIGVSVPAVLPTLPHVDCTYIAFFRQLASRLRGIRTKVFVVPSTSDMANPHPLPQPPYSSSAFSSDPSLGQQITLLPNPSFLYVNEMRLLLTSADPLMEVGTQLAYPRNLSGHDELITSCCVSLLRQRSLFPNGGSSTLAMDPKRFPACMFDAAAGDQDSIPHIVIFPSNAKAGAASNKTHGAFACIAEDRLFVIPYSPRVATTSGRVEWTSVYVYPPPSQRDAEVDTEVGAGSDEQLAGQSETTPIVLQSRVTVRHYLYSVS